jgi:hypothetical protein
VKALVAAAGMALVLVAPLGAALIVGSSGSDLLLGTSKRDRIASFGGNDRIDVAGGGLDRVSCGLGTDLVAADATDRLSGCEVVSRRISRDPYRGGGAQHATQAEPDSFSWGTKVVATFQVARYTDGGAQAIGFAVSSNSGRTWRSGVLPELTVVTRPRGEWLRASDPVVAYDALHGSWLTLGLGASDSALLVSTSADGLRWSAPFTAIRRPNNRDTDGGATFSPATRIAPSFFSYDGGVRSGPFPSAEVGADGTVMMAWPDCSLRAGCSSNDLFFSKSADGLTWSRLARIPLGAGNHIIDGLGADPSRPGRVAVAFYTDRGGMLDVRLVWSTNGGATWSRPLRLSPERMPTGRIAYAGGAMVGDYISTSFAGGRAVPVFTLAQSRLRGRFRQATYASSVAVP